MAERRYGTADSFVEAVMLDIWPSAGVCLDYGIPEPDAGDVEVYAAYQRAVKRHGVTAAQLHGALMSQTPGKSLTALLRKHGERVTITSVYDDWDDREPEDCEESAAK